jgi:hypothetical protein
MTCQHGNEGYCHDEATPAEREAMRSLHEHAFNWALPYGRDEAERYAAAYTAENYAAAAEGDVTVSHSHALYEKLTGVPRESLRRADIRADFAAALGQTRAHRRR